LANKKAICSFLDQYIKEKLTSHQKIEEQKIKYETVTSFFFDLKKIKSPNIKNNTDVIVGNNA